MQAASSHMKAASFYVKVALFVSALRFTSYNHKSDAETY
jgi:hypothetical protein